MKLSKFLPAIGFITLICLIYVYQQTEIFRLAYLGQRHMSEFQDLLDKNALMRYNIGKKISLVQIGDKISASSDFEMPQTYRFVELASVQGAAAGSQGLPKENVFVKIFGIKRQAEAKTINP